MQNCNTTHSKKCVEHDKAYTWGKETYVKEITCWMMLSSKPSPHVKEIIHWEGNFFFLDCPGKQKFINGESKNNINDSPQPRGVMAPYALGKKNQDTCNCS